MILAEAASPTSNFSVTASALTNNKAIYSFCLIDGRPVSAYKMATIDDCSRIERSGEHKRDFQQV